MFAVMQDTEMEHCENSYCLTFTAPWEAELQVLFTSDLTIQYFPSLLFL